MSYVIAEIGINHNGDIDLAKELIDMAHTSGCDAVKFQKRNVEEVYSKEELDKPRESPWGTTTREQKHGIEFNIVQYKELEEYAWELEEDIEENSKGIAIIKKENELQDVQIEEIKLSTSNPLGG